MADYDFNRLIRGQAAEAGAIDAGLRKYMLQVYNYMLLALVVTGITAYGVYMAAVTAEPNAYRIAENLYLSSVGVTLFVSPLKWVLIFAPLVVSLMIWNRIRTVSIGAAQMWFWLFAVLIGVSMSSIFILYATTSIAEVFFITAAAFGGLSLYGYTTKRDLSGIGSFLIMGVWGLIIAMMVNMIFNSPMMMWVLSVAGVGIFAGLTAYYSQAIKEMYVESDSGETATRKSILGALALYISFINMFRFLLFLIGGRR